MTKAIIEQLVNAMNTHGSPYLGHIEEYQAALIAAREYLAQPNTQEPVAWYPTEDTIAALKRFEETCADNEGYDVPKDTMRNLQAIGLIYRTYGDMYCITDFGQSILTAHGVKP